MPELYNRDIKLLFDLMDDLKKEIKESQSARLHVGYISTDARRMTELIQILQRKVVAAETGDFPETHPVIIPEGGT